MFLLRLGIFFAFLTLIYLSQRFWFVGTWHWIGAIQRSNLRNGLQILWFVGLLTMLAGFLDPMLGHALSKIAGGKWITAATRIWLVASRSEEHTSELQSHSDLVCRLLLEKKK